MVFHKAFLSGMRFTNGLVSFVDTVASQVIARVEELRIQLHSGQGKPTPVSVILAQEAGGRNAGAGVRRSSAVHGSSVDRLRVSRIDCR